VYFNICEYHKKFSVCPQSSAPKRYFLFVQSNAKNKSSKDVKQKLTNKINPRIEEDKDKRN